jgi:CHAT domain-containing protein/tetratricopeptide (TPR) repeat protein
MRHVALFAALSASAIFVASLLTAAAKADTRRPGFVIPADAQSLIVRVQATHSTFRSIADVQRFLKGEGLYSGPIDGNYGTATQQGILDLAKLGDAARAEGRYERAEAIFGELLDASEIIGWGREDSVTMVLLSNFASAIDAQGRHAEAETFYRRVLETRERTLGADHPDTLAAYNNLAGAFAAQGRYGEAEVLFRRVLATYEEAFGPEHPETLAALTNLANCLDNQGRLREAEKLHLRAVQTADRVFGPDDPRTLTYLNNLAATLNGLGRSDLAEKYYRQVFEGRERQLGQDHPETIAALDNMAVAIARQGRPQDAEPLFRRTLEAQETSLGTDNPETLRSLNNLANSLMNQGRYDEAEELFTIVLALEERLLGAGHPETMLSLDNLAHTQVLLGDIPSAIATGERGFAGLSEFFLRDAGAPISHQRDNLPFDPRSWLWIAWKYRTDLPQIPARSFEAQGWLTFGALDVTLADLGSRLRLPPGPEASALRDLQDARDAVQTARRVYLASFDDPGVTDAARKPLADRLTEAESRFAAASARIERDFPALAEIQLPRALKADEAQALLRPGEGLVAYASTEDVLFAWLVTKDRIEWRQIDQTAADLASRVSGLRAAVDFDAVAPAQPPARACALSSPYAGMEDRAFDLCAAQELHGLVLGQFDLSGIEELIVVPDGALEQLPFSLLVTGTDADRSPHWLIEDLAISTLPTTSSLRALRQAAPARADSGTGRLPYLGLAPATFGDQPAVPELRSGRYDLPSTADEVRFISGVLAAGREGVVTGPAASEAWVRSADLSRYVVISFATHALLSREAEDITGGAITEPALLLHPGDGQDGFLTASEAATLRLDADWVLLSACNTAAGEAADAEGLSGLARAFFFAGAKALMVSHWKVDDSAAMALMTETMQRSASRNMSRAQALRQAMLTVMNSPDQDYRHPFFWAPFVLVGETAK